MGRTLLVWGIKIHVQNIFLPNLFSSFTLLYMKSMFQVKELVKCSLENEVLFEAPRVKIVFASGITKSLHRKISKVMNTQLFIYSCKFQRKI